METKTMTQLVEEIESGADDAWTELVRRLQPTVQVVLRRFRVDEEVRNDVAGEVWRLLFERLDTIDDPERLRGWIAVVASNQMASALRRASRRREQSATSEVMERLASVEDADRVVETEVGELLGRAVAKLTPREQTVIRCRAWTDSPESLESMERRHGIPAGSIGPTLGRGLRKLRRDPQLMRFFASA